MEVAICLLLAQSNTPAGVVIDSSTLTAWLVAAFGFIITGLIAIVFWFAKDKLDKIESKVELVPSMDGKLCSMEDIVTGHAQRMPQIDMTLALMQERHAHHDEKLDNHDKEINRLRDWRHNLSNVIQKHVTSTDLEAATKVAQ